MAHEPGTAGVPAAERREIDIWMIVAIVAIGLALIAAYLAFTYKQQVDDWEAAADETVAALQAAGVELQSTVESGVAGYEEQISGLEGALERSQTQAGISAAELEQTQQELSSTQADLEAARADLASTEQELAETQAALDDAIAKLEQLGELVLPDGTYVGPVLGARTDPFPAILFQDGSAWRVAEVAPDATITSGGQDLTLEGFADLLQSTDPAAVELANGNYKVIVKQGLVTSIRKSQG